MPCGGIERSHNAICWLCGMLNYMPNVGQGVFESVKMK